MMYVWAAIAIAVLFLVWQIIRWWNLPATIEARAKAAAARSERWNARPGLFGWRARKGVNTPKGTVPPVPPVSVAKPAEQELPPTPDTAEAIKRATKPLLDGPVARRIRARKNKKDK